MSLKDTFSKAFGIGDLKYALIGLIEAKLELKKIELQEQLGAQLTDLVFLLITILLSLALIIFSSILLAIGINKLLDSEWYGFAILTALYTVILIVWVSNKQVLKRKIDKRVSESVNEKINSFKKPK